MIGQWQSIMIGQWQITIQIINNTIYVDYLLTLNNHFFKEGITHIISYLGKSINRLLIFF